MDRIISSGARRGLVTAPASKSAAHRQLICAALSAEKSVLKLGGRSNDIDSTIGCLTALGAKFAFEKDEIKITPIASAPKGSVRLPCGESGSTLRFLLPIAGALGADAVFEMEGRLPSRPMDALVRQLTAHGLDIRKGGNLLRCSGRLTGGDFALPGDVSSQFVSGLLFALPLVRGRSTITVDGELESLAYVDMTLNALAHSGIRIDRRGGSYEIEGGQTYRSPEWAKVEADWSNAAFFLCMGAFSQRGVTVTGLDPASAQGDRAILDILRSFGAIVSCDGGAVTVRKGSLLAQSVDARAVPDLVPAVACVAALSEGTSRIVNAARLRLKESDRLATTAAMLASLGADIAVTEDSLVVHGKPCLDGGTADSFGDHRIAMAAALVASCCRRDVKILNAQSVNKSFPGFFGELEKLTLENGTSKAERNI